MAKAKEKINKSQMVRDILGQDPKLKVKDIVANLAEQGVKISPNQVYMVISKTHRKKQRQKREAVVTVSREAGNSSPYETVTKIKALAADLGGIRHLKKLVDLLAE